MNGPDHPLYGEWCEVHREEWQDHDCDQYGDPAGDEDTAAPQPPPTYPVVGVVEGPDGWVKVTVEIPERVYRDLFAHTITPGAFSVVEPVRPTGWCPTRPTHPRPLGERVSVPGRLL